MRAASPTVASTTELAKKNQPTSKIENISIRKTGTTMANSTAVEPSASFAKDRAAIRSAQFLRPVVSIERTLLIY